MQQHADSVLSTFTAGDGDNLALQHWPVPEGTRRRGIVVIVETDSAGRLGLVVDELVGQQQIVVKSLEANYGRVGGVSGATILGNGRVALILDVPGLAAPAERQPRPAVQQSISLQ